MKDEAPSPVPMQSTVPAMLGPIAPPMQITMEATEKSDEQKAMIQAIKECDTEAIKRLGERNRHLLSETDILGKTPMHIAAEMGDIILMRMKPNLIEANPKSIK